MSGIDLTGIGMAFAAGATLGAGYFGGLWLTVCRLSKARSPYRLYGFSLLLRLALILGGFYLLAPKGAAALLAAGGGFMVARQLWLVSKRGGSEPPAAIDRKDG